MLQQVDSHCPIFGIAPRGHEAARDAEKAESQRERIRLWYVAATRAREFLLLPRLSVPLQRNAWANVVDHSLGVLPSFDVSHFPAEAGVQGSEDQNKQTRDVFAVEAAAIAEGQPHLTWLAPSRDESPTGSLLQREERALWIGRPNGEPEPADTARIVQGSRECGLILHKLMEEVLNGETSSEVAQLSLRAREHIRALGCQAVDDSAVGISPGELADCIVRTLALPEIVALRADLVAELPIYASSVLDAAETAMAGIVDAMMLNANGQPAVVIDWKSDVAPDARRLEHYQGQVRVYLEMTRAERGLIVLMSSGIVIGVTSGAALLSVPS